jgi:hypothetical protein
VTKRAIRADSLGLVLVVAASAVLYFWRLGFYSDDWSILAHLEVGGSDRSFGALLERTFDNHEIRTRPVYGVWITVLYRLFGLEPTGYHVVNTLVLAAGAVLLYRTLRELGGVRPVALAVPLVYAVLPHYSTDRFWFISCHVPLSMATWCLALYAALRAAGGTGRSGAWWTLSFASLAASVLTYEVFLPLALLNAAVVALHWRRLAPGMRAAGRVLALGLAAQWLVVLALALAKARLTGRLVDVTLAERIAWFTDLLGDAARLSTVGEYGLRLPLVLLQLLGRDPGPAVPGLAAALGVAVAVWLWRAGAGARFSRPAMALLVGAGAIVFLAGWTIFFVALNAAVSATGMNNRTAMAAALGVALAAVGAIGWLASWLPGERAPRACFATAVALLCGSGVLVVNALGADWGAAAARQRLVMEDLRPRLAALPAGSRLLLDGVCRYVGPAPVFDSPWDFTGALHVLARDTRLAGDVVTPKLRVSEEGIYTRVYNVTYGPYPYSGLFVYDHARGVIVPVGGPRAMLAYLREHNPTRSGGCPPGEEGEGVQVFR